MKKQSGKIKPTSNILKNLSRTTVSLNFLSFDEAKPQDKLDLGNSSHLNEKFE